MKIETCRATSINFQCFIGDQKKYSDDNTERKQPTDSSGQPRQLKQHGQLVFQGEVQFLLRF